LLREDEFEIAIPDHESRLSFSELNSDSIRPNQEQKRNAFVNSAQCRVPTFSISDPRSPRAQIEDWHTFTNFCI